MDPPEGFVGEDIPITITLENNIEEVLEVRAIDVDFYWDATVWDWGAMSLQPLGSQSETGFIELPADEDTYQVDITVHGKGSKDFFESSCDFVGSFDVRLVPPPPALIVSANPNGGAPPLEVTFDVIVNDGEPPFAYSWTFGDGSSGSGLPVSHIYTAPGTFVAQVVVTDSLLRSAAESVTVTVADGSAGVDGIGGLGETLALVLVVSLGIVVAVLLVVIVVLLRRGRRVPPESPPL